MKHLWLMGLATASVALADEPLHRPADALPEGAADFPIRLWRTSAGPRVPADDTAGVRRLVRADTLINLELSSGMINRNGHPHAWQTAAAGDSIRHLSLGPGGDLVGVAWSPACHGLQTEAPAPAPSSPGRASKRISAGPGHDFPTASYYYPAESIALGETGAITIRACVGTHGFLTAAPTVQRSSGFPLLDRAALQVACDGSGKYRPATADGVPVDSCFVFKVTFVANPGAGANGR